MTDTTGAGDRALLSATAPTPKDGAPDAWPQQLQEAAQRCTDARAALAAQVWEARERGRSWQQIGDALGITRQAAWERFKDSPAMTGGA